MKPDTGETTLHHLRDGTPVRLRMIGPADRARLAAGFAKLSPESRYRRFFTAMPRLSDRTLDRLVATDGWNHVAIGAEVVSDDPAEAEGLGVAHFVRLPEAPEVAEVAVAVIDARHRLGLGHLLLQALVKAARARGIRRFRATILGDNAPARALLEDVADQFTVRREDSALVYEVALPEGPEDELRGGILYRLLSLAAGGLQFVFDVLGRHETVADDPPAARPSARENPMATSIVDARPEHARFIAWTVLTAFRSHLPRGLWDFFVGGDESQCLRYLEALATTTSAHWAHYSSFLVAEVDGRPAAALCGYFDEERGLPALQAGTAEVDARLARGVVETQAGRQRIAPVFFVIPEHAPGAWIVENVATWPEYRRRGLIDALLSAILDRGRQRGATHADIGVMIGNDPAQRAYEKAGFRVTAEKRHPEFERVWGAPGIRALTRRL